MAWTQFWDMHSGGDTKVPPYESIYIEAPMRKAIEVFRSRFDRDPHHVTCDCCGADYVIDEAATLESVSGYQRGCEWSEHLGGYIDRPSGRPYDRYISLADYVRRPDVLVIRAGEIDQ